jgi:hypothetical protein
VIAYRRIFTLIIGLSLVQFAYGQGGTIRVDKNAISMELFGMHGNQSGSPQSFIILIDETKAVFINSYYDANYVWNHYRSGEHIEGKSIPGRYKISGSQLFIFLTKGISFKGNRIDDALFLRDHTGSEVIFYKVFK